jgi:hypothetical protein
VRVPFGARAPDRVCHGLLALRGQLVGVHVTP